VAQLVEVLHYQLEGRAFYSRWGYWNFSLTSYAWPHYGPGVDWASNINEYQEYFGAGAKCGRYVGLTTLHLHMSRNSGSLNSWSPEGLSMPVMRRPDVSADTRGRIWQRKEALDSCLVTSHSCEHTRHISLPTQNDTSPYLFHNVLPHYGHNFRLPTGSNDNFRTT
jgi:hypothetical protein